MIRTAVNIQCGRRVAAERAGAPGMDEHPGGAGPVAGPGLAHQDKQRPDCGKVLSVFGEPALL